MKSRSVSVALAPELPREQRVCNILTVRGRFVPGDAASGLVSVNKWRRESVREKTNERTRERMELVDQRERRAARNIEGRRLVSIMSARSEKTVGDGWVRAEVVEAGMEFLKNVRPSPDAPPGAASRAALRISP